MATHRFSRYYWIVAIAIVLLGLFYWYEIRPISVYRSCSANASIDARALLASKAEIASDTNRAQYQRLIGKNMYLRSDYESFLKKCLLYHGLPATSDQPVPEDAAADAAAN